jgi:hypothetical protein
MLQRRDFRTWGCPKSVEGYYCYYWEITNCQGNFLRSKHNATSIVAIVIILTV